MMKLNRNLTRERADGTRVILATPRTLQLDLDSPAAVRRYGWQWQLLKRAEMARGWREKILPSKTRGHVHIIITLPQPLPLGTRIALQALLGSDIKREMFNWIRGSKRSKFPVVLFERRKRVSKR